MAKTVLDELADRTSPQFGELLQWYLGKSKGHTLRGLMDFLDHGCSHLENLANELGEDAKLTDQIK